MATNLQASRLMVRQAANFLDQQHSQSASFCAMAKLFATDHCFQVLDRNIDTFGFLNLVDNKPMFAITWWIWLLERLQGPAIHARLSCSSNSRR